MQPPRKSSLYSHRRPLGHRLVHEIVAKATDPKFVPTPLTTAAPMSAAGCGRRCAVGPRVLLVNFTATILRRIRPPTVPGVRTTLAGTAVSVFNTHPDRASGRPGTSCAAATSGARPHRRRVPLDRHVRTANRRRGSCRPRRRCTIGWRRCRWQLSTTRTSATGHRLLEIGYQRLAGLRAEFRVLQRRHVHRAARAVGGRAARRPLPNTPGCCAARRRTLRQLHPYQRHPRSARPGDRSLAHIQAINDVCRRHAQPPLAVASVVANAGAGGAMLALGADLVLARWRCATRTTGRWASTAWSTGLRAPRRAGVHRAESLTCRCSPSTRGRRPDRAGGPGASRPAGRVQGRCDATPRGRRRHADALRVRPHPEEPRPGCAEHSVGARHRLQMPNDLLGWAQLLAFGCAQVSFGG